MQKLVLLMLLLSSLSTSTIVKAETRAEIPTLNELRETTAPDIQYYLRRNPPPTVDTQDSPPFARRAETGQAIRDKIRLEDQLFSPEFWDKHPSYYPIADNADIWQEASWSRVKNWLTVPFATNPFYFENNVAYPQDEEINSQPNGKNSEDFAGNGWLPLGVFALTRESKYFPSPKIFMQLALNKSGELAGNLYDSAYEENFPLIGQVESNTQRAVWKMLHSANSPIIETGLYNLTLNETPVKFTYADGSVQDFFLVRVHPENRAEEE